MAATLTNIILALCIALPVCVLSQGNNYLDIEQPSFFQYNSPLQHPESLRSRPYFDFLSTLYRHDTTKTDLFRPYARQRRDVAPPTSQVVASVRDPLAVAAAESFSRPEKRPRRAILFRPVFVYKQQQVRKQEAARRRKRI